MIKYMFWSSTGEQNKRPSAAVACAFIYLRELGVYAARHAGKNTRR